MAYIKDYAEMAKKLIGEFEEGHVKKENVSANYAWIQKVRTEDETLLLRTSSYASEESFAIEMWTRQADSVIEYLRNTKAEAGTDETKLAELVELEELCQKLLGIVAKPGAE